MLEIYGIVTKGKKSIDILSPKICPNEHCREPNTQDARFCSKCKMIMSFEGYQEALQKQQEKESEVQLLRQKYEEMEEKFRRKPYTTKKTLGACNVFELW